MRAKDGLRGVKSMMRKSIIMLLTVMFCLQTVCFQAETTTEQVAETETEAEAEIARLVFSSFDGGGPEYWIEIEDPQIVTYTGRKVYDDPDHEMMTGSGYNEIYTFTGLKPGTTKMTVSMYSPLMESEDSVYTVFVDDDLNVTISRERAISRFNLYRYGEIHYDSYEIVMLMGDYSVSINGDDFKNIADNTAERLFQVVSKYDLFQWNGFDKSQDDVLDGEGFLLEIDFTDGASIKAQGDNAFPENYLPAMGEMQEILDNMKTARTLTIGDGT